MVGVLSAEHFIRNISTKDNAMKQEAMLRVCYVAEASNLLLGKKGGKGGGKEDLCRWADIDSRLEEETETDPGFPCFDFTAVVERLRSGVAVQPLHVITTRENSRPFGVEEEESTSVEE